MFAIKTEVLQQLLQDQQCVDELNKAKTTREVEQIIAKYARKNGFKVETVRVDN